LAFLERVKAGEFDQPDDRDGWDGRAACVLAVVEP